MCRIVCLALCLQSPAEKQNKHNRDLLGFWSCHERDMKKKNQTAVDKTRLKVRDPGVAALCDVIKCSLPKLNVSSSNLRGFFFFFFYNHTARTLQPSRERGASEARLFLDGLSSRLAFCTVAKCKRIHSGRGSTERCCRASTGRTLISL